MIIDTPGFVVFALGMILLGGLSELHYSVATTLLLRLYGDGRRSGFIAPGRR